MHMQRTRAQAIVFSYTSAVRLCLCLQWISRFLSCKVRLSSSRSLHVAEPSLFRLPPHCDYIWPCRLSQRQYFHFVATFPDFPTLSFQPGLTSQTSRDTRSQPGLARTHAGRQWSRHHQVWSSLRLAPIKPAYVYTRVGDHCMTMEKIVSREIRINYFGLWEGMILQLRESWRKCE